MSAVCSYFFAPWYYLPKLMPEGEPKSYADVARRVGRYVFGIIGFGAGITAVAFAAPLVYDGASKANASATDATTPDGTPLKSESVTTADKAGGGIAAAFVSYFLLAHITVFTVAVGGVLTDCLISACETTAEKCSRAASCIKRACCCPKPKKEEVEMDPEMQRGG